MKATHWLGVGMVAAALSASPAMAAGDSAKYGVQQQGASAGASSGAMQHDQSTVRQAQERLSQLGYSVGKPDGMVGPQTREGIRNYQEEKGLEATGRLDAQTMASLGLDDAGSSGTAAGASSGTAAGSSSMSPSAPGAPTMSDEPSSNSNSN